MSDSITPPVTEEEYLALAWRMFTQTESPNYADDYTIDTRQGSAVVGRCQIKFAHHEEFVEDLMTAYLQYLRFIESRCPPDGVKTTAQGPSRPGKLDANPSADPKAPLGPDSKDHHLTAKELADNYGDYVVRAMSSRPQGGFLKSPQMQAFMATAGARAVVDQWVGRLKAEDFGLIRTLLLPSNGPDQNQPNYGALLKDDPRVIAYLMELRNHHGNLRAIKMWLEGKEVTGEPDEHDQIKFKFTRSYQITKPEQATFDNLVEIGYEMMDHDKDYDPHATGSNNRVSQARKIAGERGTTPEQVAAFLNSSVVQIPSAVQYYFTQQKPLSKLEKELAQAEAEAKEQEQALVRAQAQVSALAQGHPQAQALAHAKEKVQAKTRALADAKKEVQTLAQALAQARALAQAQERARAQLQLRNKAVTDPAVIGTNPPACPEHPSSPAVPDPGRTTGAAGQRADGGPDSHQQVAEADLGPGPAPTDESQAEGGDAGFDPAAEAGQGATRTLTIAADQTGTTGPAAAAPKLPYEGLPVLWQGRGLTVFDMSAVPMPKLGTPPEVSPVAESRVGGRSQTTAKPLTSDDIRAIVREVVLDALEEQARRPRVFSREELRIITRAVFDRMDELADRPATGRAGFDGRMSKQFVSTYNPRGLRW